MKSTFCALKTPFEQDRSTDWQREYPRPQMKRDSYCSLCGAWDLWVIKKGSEQYLGKITVPFPPESRLSGVERTLKRGEIYRYEKKITLPTAMQTGRVLLHFGAVDQIAKVYINDRPAGTHTGGYLPFSLEITALLVPGENKITVEADDRLNKNLAYGKQRKKRGGMWYTPISGIWQPVWLEGVPDNYIHSLRITSTLNSVTIETKGGNNHKTLTLVNGQKYTYRGDVFTLTIDAPHCWSPEDPYLYPFTLTDGADTLQSYFALRTVTVERRKGQPVLCLNGKPYFFHGLLDQGYFSDGIYLPATPKGYVFDIQTMKNLGFNTLRKHIKIEPDLFYYYCDKYGMIVFQDMVNSGKYSFLADTALPTVGIKRRKKLPPLPERKKQFELDCKQTVTHLFNHPCVCYYTIFNEGWGQYDADRIYGEMKAADSTRIWDATSGWFFEKQSDVQSEHIYFKKIEFKPSDRPLVLSEFGGYACKIKGHTFNVRKDYGYKTCQTPEDLERELVALYREQILPAVENGLCAAVLTQVSDVEDEVNGLVTYDRQYVKVTEESMQSVAGELQRAFENQWY